MKLDLEERKHIENMLRGGMSCRVIADLIDRGYSTIKREVRMNGGRKHYNARDAQAAADRRAISSVENMEDIIKSVVELYKDGKTCGQIAEILNLTVLQVQRGLMQFVFIEQHTLMETVLDRLKKMEHALKCRGVYV